MWRRLASPQSIRASLLVWLLPLVAVVLIVGLIIDFKNAAERGIEAYDFELIDTAVGVRNSLQFGPGLPSVRFPETLERALNRPGNRTVYFRLVGPAGERLAGELEQFTITERESLRSGMTTAFGSFAGRSMRIVVMPMVCGPARCSIEVAEPISLREQLRWRMFAESVLPEILLSVLILAGIWFGIVVALRPVERLSADIYARGPHNLDPIDEGRAPSEIRPILSAVNTHLERATAVSQRMRDFTTDAAHQLRTPLAVLQARVELARHRIQAGALQTEIDAIHEATLRMGRVANQLLSYARLAEYEIDRSASFDLKTVVEELATEYVYRAIAKNIDLGFDIESVSICGSPVLMREALANVIANAIEYGPAQSAVTVRIMNRGSSAIVEVEDEGPGVAPAERERVFDRFYRVPGTDGAGSGIGLAIVQQIVHDHGGTVRILDAPGGGCLVRFEFGAVQPSHRAVERNGIPVSITYPN